MAGFQEAIPPSPEVDSISIQYYLNTEGESDSPAASACVSKRGGEGSSCPLPFEKIPGQVLEGADDREAHDVLALLEVVCQKPAAARSDRGCSDEGVPPGQAEPVMDLLEELVKEGKIRWYGWSTDHPDRAWVFAQGEHCATIQTTLNVFYDAPDMLELVEKFGLACLNKHPLASGSLTGKFHADYQFPEDDLRHGIDWTSERGQRRLAQVDALRDILTSGGRTMAQGAIAWIWARSPRTIPIPGFKTVAQVEENAGAMEFGPLSDEQMQQVDALLKSNA